MKPVELANACLSLAILPAIGGGIARFDRLTAQGPVPLFRPWDGETASPRALGCFPLVPFSNRLGGHGIEAGGRFWPLAANRPGEPYPIHGDGWQRSWSVIGKEASSVVLGLESNDLAPFDYRAELAYALDGPAMTMRLSVEHRGAVPVPYGLGFHPWLPRAAKTLLEAPASHVWLETPDHLPDREVLVEERPEWDFREPRPLPRGPINNAFPDWSGRALITWPESGTRLSIEADAALATAIVYSPGAASDFFCFEPVSHVVDAHRLPGLPGLRVLHEGERFAAACRFITSEV